MRVGEAGVVVTRERGEHRVLRKARLHDHLALDPAAPGPPGHLRQQREHALGRAEVGAGQAAVGVEHDHQCEALEVVPLGDHLGADQEVDLAGVGRVDAARTARRRRATSRSSATDARGREQLSQSLFEALRAAAQRREVDVTAFGTTARHRGSAPQW